MVDKRSNASEESETNHREPDLGARAWQVEGVKDIVQRAALHGVNVEKVHRNHVVRAPGLSEDEVLAEERA